MTRQEQAHRALTLLKDFNRKERYHLLRSAVSGEPFKLTAEFRQRLNTTLSKQTPGGQNAIQVPDDSGVFVAMDYHLDWIAAALILVDKGDDQEVRELEGSESKKRTKDFEHWLPDQRETKKARCRSVIKGNQEDTDLLIAFVDPVTGRLCLILVEAKVESGWDGNQIRSKGRRLWDIFGNTGDAFDFAHPHLVLAGPGAEEQPPRFKDLEECPAFFFQPATVESHATAVNPKCPDHLCVMNLVADHALYQPSRISKDDDERRWYVARSFTPDAG